jgi:RecA-family ATPase
MGEKKTSYHNFLEGKECISKGLRGLLVVRGRLVMAEYFRYLRVTLQTSVATHQPFKRKSVTSNSRHEGYTKSVPHTIRNSNKIVQEEYYAYKWHHLTRNNTEIIEKVKETFLNRLSVFLKKALRTD